MNNDWVFDDENQDWRITLGHVTYIVADSARRIDFKGDKFVAMRSHATDEFDTRMNVIDGVLCDEGICCGLCHYSAAGAPACGYKDTAEECKLMCKKDYEKNFAHLKVGDCVKELEELEKRELEFMIQLREKYRQKREENK